MRSRADRGMLDGCSAASAMASSAATIAYCAYGSSRCASLRSMCAMGSKPFTSHANVVSHVDASNDVMGAAPLRPASRPAQNVGTDSPIGVMAPRPVTTTRASREVGMDERGWQPTAVRRLYDMMTIMS